METFGKITKSRDGAYYTATVVRRAGRMKCSISQGGILSLEEAQKSLDILQRLDAAAAQKHMQSNDNWLARTLKLFGFWCAK